MRRDFFSLLLALLVEIDEHLGKKVRNFEMQRSNERRRKNTGNAPNLRPIRNLTLAFGPLAIASSLYASISGQNVWCAFCYA